MKFQNLLSDLGASIGLASLQPDDSGACRLVFNGKVSIDLETDNEPEKTLLMHTVVGRMPSEGRRDFCLKLLSGNYLAHMTHGAVLGIDTTTGEVVLHRRLRLDACDTKMMANELAALVSTALQWTTRLETHHGQKPANADAANEMLTAAGMIRV